MKRILILYTSIGLGHKTIAENIGSMLRSKGFEVRLEDCLRVQDGWLVQIGKSLHYFINVALPWLWNFLYTNKLFTKFTLSSRLKVASKNYRATLNLMQDFQPDIVITTQTVPSAVIAYLKKEKKSEVLFGIAFSDFHLHPYWLYEQADFYIVNIDKQRQEMIEHGIASERIFVCGFSVGKKPEPDIIDIKSRLGIKASQKVVLVSSGSLGLGVRDDILELLRNQMDIFTVVVCGKNEKVFRRLASKFSGSLILICPFYSPMCELYAVSDIFLTKPGGLSTVEALQWRLPMIIVSMLPGQEQLNLDYLIKHGLVQIADKDIMLQIRAELETSRARNFLKNNTEVDKLLAVPGEQYRLEEYLRQS